MGNSLSDPKTCSLFFGKFDSLGNEPGVDTNKRKVDSEKRHAFRLTRHKIRHSSL